jgi:hypothetical protein
MLQGHCLSKNWRPSNSAKNDSIDLLSGAITAWQLTPKNSFLLVALFGVVE